MRSRRHGLSEAVSVLGMDPWKDDRVRDFVAINTIQRLRAYHLKPGAPMPPIEEVNADRALNLLLLPRAQPDYRPCAGERPQTRAELRMRRLEKGRVKEQRKSREGEGDKKVEGATESRQYALYSSPASSTATFPTTSSSDSDDDNKRDWSQYQREGKEDAPLNQIPIHRPLRNRLSHSPEASLDTTTSSSTQCAIDRARALFFGATAFHSSTSPRRLVNSPHVPLTPSTSPATERHASSHDGPPSPGPAAAAATDRTPTTMVNHHSSHEDTVGVKEHSVNRLTGASTTSRALHMDLDAYIEVNSTPLRLAPPPPLESLGTAEPTISTTTLKDTQKKEKETKGDEKDDVAASASASRKGVDVIAAQHHAAPSLDTAAVAIRPSTEKTHLSATHVDSAGANKSEQGEQNYDGHCRSCGVCDAIIQYFQSLLTRGVVLDRYNHKDLAFAWWVLGRNMDTAALESRGPMRREALLITIRDLYYSLLSAKEAKEKAKDATMTAAEVSTHAVNLAAADAGARGEVADGVPVTRGSKTDEEERAVTEQRKLSKGAAAATASAVLPGPTTRSRGRGRNPSLSSTRVSAITEELSKTPTGRSARHRCDEDATSTEKGSTADLHATALRSEDGSQDGLAKDGYTSSESTSLTSSATTSHTGSATPIGPSSNSSAGGDRQRRVNAQQCVAEDTWTSTRTNRCAALAKLVVALELRPGTAASIRRRAARASDTKEENSPATETARSVKEEEVATQGAAETEHKTSALLPEDKQKGSWEWRAGAKSSTASRAKPKAKVTAKRARSPDSDNDNENGEVSKSTPTAQENAETEKAPKKPRGKKGRQTTATRTPSSTVKVPHFKVENDIADPSGELQDQSVDITAAVIAAPDVTTSKKGKRQLRQQHQQHKQQEQQPPPPPPPEKKEEHRGRPRGSFKIPRPIVDGVPAATTGGGSSTLKTSTSTAAAANRSRGGEKRQGNASSPSTSSPFASLLAGDVSLGAVFTTLTSDHGNKKLPEPREMPVGLTAHERAVRTRIQRRMGVPLLPPAVPPPSSSLPAPSSELTSQTQSESAAADTSMMVYSSYTFLLSSFASHGQPAAGKGSVATTAPVVWYGPAAPAARPRGQKKRVEGGVDRTVLGVAFRHDQEALERQVKVRLAREAAEVAHMSFQSSLISPNHHSTEEDVLETANGVKSAEPNVKREISGGAEADVDTRHNMREESPSALSATLYYPISSLPSEEVPQTSSIGVIDFSIPPSEDIPKSSHSGHRTADTQGSHLSPLSPLPADFSELTYAQQCLLVWTAGDLLERHERRRHAAEARRSRLLSRCGRMATRRMAARVAAVAAATNGSVSDEVDSSAEQLVKSFVQEENTERTVGSDGSSAESDDSADDGNEDKSENAHMKQKRNRLLNSENMGDRESDSEASSESSMEDRPKAWRPLPRQLYDYWAMYRTSGSAAVSADVINK